MELSRTGNGDGDRLLLGTDNNELGHEGVENAEEVVKISSPDSEVEPEIRETKNLLQFLENLGARDVLDKKRNESQPKLMWEVWEEETERWLDQHMREDSNLENSNEIMEETVDASPDFVMPLLRYQKEWLAWGLKQEDSASRGGILADEMGMGKTVQAIALVLAKRALSRELSGPGPAELAASSSTLPCVKTTLVICPLIAVMQWVNEIDQFTANGSTKVLAYHGPNRGKTLFEFSEYDFIITTYSIVESEYRKHFMPPKESCEWCGKKLYARTMKIHTQRYCTGVKIVKQSKQQKKKGEDLSDEEDDKKKASKKNTKGKRMMENSETGDMISYLHSVKWTRIILDEAHYIKDRRGSTTRAVFALEASYRWALSGTPFQNHAGELYSLVRFLQVTPYSYYFCKDCDCKGLEYTTNSSLTCCPHGPVRHFSWWNAFIALPIQDRGASSRARAMVLLKDKVLKCIMLRRTKKGRTADLSLPSRTISVRRDYLDATENEYYTSLKMESRNHIHRYAEEGTLMSNYGHIFSLLTRLRKAADHPYLVEYSTSAVARGTGKNKYNNEQACGVCHDVAEEPVVTSCEHLFCKSCLINFSACFGQPACPSCSKPLTVDFSANNHDQETQKPKSSLKGFKSSSILNRIPLENFQTSTKIDALKEEIRFMAERDASAKGIVFSQFTSFLDLIHYSLQKSGMKCVQLDGSMTMAAREAAITRFTDEGDCRIFLMSLKASGVALNLTVASHVFLMDPWWNPAVEQQAQDRIYRIGQYKPIRVVKFVIENTVEEDILEMQEKRRLGFKGTIGGCKDALGKLDHSDLIGFFLRV
ncbi:ATP-dependent helicase rhp16-like [Bidens hawaiensis]|uniref:ATP-dependent helicase rhp16-like n=1 Tax=Bidens hawaiensis TaxID=980011 RepID=UPI00404AB296